MARGAPVHRSLQLGCKRSGIVTWVTGQRVDGLRLWFGDLVRCCSDYANLNFGQTDPETPKSETSKVGKKITRVEFKVTLCYLMTPKRMLVHSESL